MDEKIKQAYEKIEPTPQASERMLEYISTARPSRRVTFKWAAAIVLLCIAFSTGVYAINLTNRADTGGRSEFVVVDPNSPEYLSRFDGGWMSRAVFVSGDPAMPFDHRGMMRYAFIPEEMDIIQEKLDGKLFTSNGEPFFFTTATDDHPRFRDTHRLALQGDRLYTKDGEPIGIIWYNTDMGYQPKDIRICTIRELNERYTTQEHAMEIIGDFRLPTVDMETFYPPTFRLGYPGVSVDFNPRDPDKGSMFYSIRLFIETIRSENEEPWQRLIGDGTIEVLTIANTQVYKITLAESSNIIYTWAYDNHSYEMHSPFQLTTDEAEAVIAQMVDN